MSECIFLQINAINAATEAACLILSVDETVKNPKVPYYVFSVDESCPIAHIMFSPLNHYLIAVIICADFSEIFSDFIII